MNIPVPEAALQVRWSRWIAKGQAHDREVRRRVVNALIFIGAAISLTSAVLLSLP